MTRASNLINMLESTNSSLKDHLEKNGYKRNTDKPEHTFPRKALYVKGKHHVEIDNTSTIAPKIKHSTDGGKTWTDKQTASNIQKHMNGKK